MSYKLYSILSSLLIWLLLLGIMYFGFIHDVCINSLFLLELFPLFECYQYSCYEHLYTSFLCGHMPSFLLSKYGIKIELLGLKVNLWITF